MKQFMALDNRLAAVNEYKNMWQEYFRYFADGFDDRKIVDQDEQNFFKIMNALSHSHYRFTELAGEFFKDGNAILDILTETVSLSALKQMSEAQFSKLCIDWHTVFINMNKAIGKLSLLRPQPKAK